MPTQVNERLFFRLGGEDAERYGAIGYLRANFSRNGCEFLPKWFDSQPHLKTDDFIKDFNEVITFLRFDGQDAPFANRDNLAAFCATHLGQELAVRGCGYYVRTQDYSFYFRCLPKCGEHEVMMFAYDNRWLLPELAGKHDLPDFCYSTHPSTGELIKIVRYEKGYRQCIGSKPNPEENRLFADTSNKFFCVTRAQEEAMLAASLFGWDSPAAKPWHYDQNGKPKLN